MKIKILTSCQESYDLIKRVIENNKEGLALYDVDLKRPEDSIAAVVWSVEDVRHYFPEGTPDNVILDSFQKIEKQLKADMTERGWDTIDILKDELIGDVIKQED